MLPFPQLLEYGNIRPLEWWDTETVLMAFDANNFVQSTGFNTDGFIDYKGISVQADAQSANNLVPQKGTSINSIINDYGTYGIVLYGSGLIANNSQIPSTYTQSDYTVDFWFRNSGSGANVLEIVPFLWCQAIANNSNKWCLWAYFKDSNGARFQNNGGGPTRPKANYASMYADTNWHHFGYTFVKSTNTHYLFIDGILIDTFVYSIVTPGTPATKFGLTGHVNDQGLAGGTGPHTAIDRFRFRNSAVWTSNFNTSTIYP